MTIKTIIEKINNSSTTEAYAFGNLWKLDGRRIWNETEQRWVNNWDVSSKGAPTKEQAKAYFMFSIGDLTQDEYREYENWLIFLRNVDEDEDEGYTATYKSFERWSKQHEVSY